jgi:hypothetical protein
MPAYFRNNGLSERQPLLVGQQGQQVGCGTNNATYLFPRPLLNLGIVDHVGNEIGHGPLTRGRITSCFLSEGGMETFLTKIFF